MGVLLMVSALIEKAAGYARCHHEGQFRKGEAREPYVTHVEEVAGLVSDFGGDAVAVAAAWLHDVVEDCTPTIEDIECVFGTDVAAVVAEVTDDKSLGKTERKSLQITTASGKSHAACLVKWADKSSNLRAIAKSPPPWSFSRKREYIAWARRVTEALPHKPANAVTYFEASVSMAVRSVEDL